VCNAIAPAEVSRVIINEGARSMELVVPDDKLSLAIGRKGQNVRLASQLTNWKLDIIAESKFLQTEREAVDALARIEGVSTTIAQTLYKLGFRSVQDIADAPVEELAAVPIVGGAEGASRLKNAAIAVLENDRQRRVRELVEGDEPVTDKLLLSLVRGMNESLLKSLDEAGIRSPTQLRDADENELARQLGLPLHKVLALKENASQLLENEAKAIAAAREHRG
jgi:N utilization substance protein A